MNPVSAIIARYIGDNIPSLTVGINLFAGWEPAEPANVVTIFDVPGMPSPVTFSGRVDISYPAIQIRIRNIEYAAGWAMAWDIRNLLHGQMNLTIYDDDDSGSSESSSESTESAETICFALIKCVQEPHILDWDEKQWVRIVSTYYCIKNN